MNETDDGARCVEHVDEVFPPRCERCDALREVSLLGQWDTLPLWASLAT
jgi:hypothetical protein